MFLNHYYEALFLLKVDECLVSTSESSEQALDLDYRGIVLEDSF